MLNAIHLDANGWQLCVVLGLCTLPAMECMRTEQCVNGQAAAAHKLQVKHL